MKRQAIPFFATPDDLAHLVGEVQASRPLSFMTAGLFDSKPTVILRDLDGSIPLANYVIFDPAHPPIAREVPQRRGPSKYAMDLKANPHAAALQYGGLVDGQRLIASQFGTISGNTQANELHALFAKAIRRRFAKVKSYYVGPGAARLLDNGVRLTPTAKSPAAYDLVRGR